MDKNRNSEELILKLKGQAIEGLLEMMKEICKNCKYFQSDVSSEACNKCRFRIREKLIRAFLG